MIRQDAVISHCKKYRYTLSRIWDESRPVILFIMLNPSKADAEQDDPTIRRCIAFAKTWGYGGLLVGNLFAYRATNPASLYRRRDPVGELNDQYLLDMATECERVVFAWGEHGSLKDAAQRIISLFPNAWCICKNKSGMPKHPLYVRKDAVLIVY